MSESTRPLKARIESTLKHDPYVNVRFIEIFDHPDNADLKRMFEVGLAINDPAPVVESEPPLPSWIPRKDGDDGDLVPA